MPSAGEVFKTGFMHSWPACLSLVDSYGVFFKSLTFKQRCPIILSVMLSTTITAAAAATTTTIIIIIIILLLILLFDFFN